MLYSFVISLIFVSAAAVFGLRAPAGGRAMRPSTFQNIVRKMNFSSKTPAEDDAAAAAAAAAGSNMPPMPPNEDVAAAAPDEDSKKKINSAVKRFRKNFNRIYAGYDMRPEVFKVGDGEGECAADDIVIFNYIESFQKKELLDKLENPNISNMEKLRLLNEKKFMYDEW
jgi:hypothetical protein